MSAEEGSAQPSTVGTDKAQGPKASATFSSFINKNTTGKKFVPKAARRRPGAAPAAAAPKPTTSEPAAPAVEAQTTRAEPELSTAPEQSTPAVQLPIPAATQEPSIQDAPQPTSTLPEAVTTAPASNTTQQLTSTATEPLPLPTTEPLPLPTTEPLPLPVPATGNPWVDDRPSHETPATEHTQLNRHGVVQEELDIERASKRRRRDPVVPAPPAITITVVDSIATETLTQAEVEVNTRLQGRNVTTSEVEQLEAVSTTTQSAATIVAQPVAEETEALRPRKRRTLPWNAVNRSQEAEEEATTAPSKTTRISPKSRGKKKSAAVEATEETQEVEQPEGAMEGEAPPVRKRPRAKARGKPKADAPPLQDGEETPAPAKRARRPRKVKSKATVVDINAGEGAEEQAEEGSELAVRRKPRKIRQTKRSAPEGEVENRQTGSQPKRKGRPPRESTPSDAEDNEIDPEITFMDSLASRNIRVGKLSTREKKMREIDWVAVRKRQREEDSRHIDSNKEREKAERALLEQQPQNDGVQTRLNADGQIEIIHSSMTVNQGADAERNFEHMEVHEEADLTTRITSRSFLKNNKRFPNDFILPGQGKRWTIDDTALFYQGLKNFGTDFQMISHMFPGSSRRSIKLKFTREEREHPELIREALLGQSQIVSNWDNFIQVSQMDEERFADADEIKREMAEVEAEMRAKIEAAQAETDERKRQQKEAGILDGDGEGTEKEGIKGRKKRKGKEKQVTFQEEAGVEILGAIDEDATWGQE